VPGWWRRPTRLIYGFSLDGQGEMQDLPSEARDLSGANVRPVLITGARGTLGRAFARLCEARGIPYRLLTRAELDIASPNSVRKALFQIHPWALINAAGYVRVDDAETERDRCYRENTQGPAVLAQECAARGIQLLTFSSDLVFGGSVLRPYVEGDDVGPLNYYGVTKADAEKRVLARLPSALVVRSSAFFSPWDEYNFVHIALKALRAKRTFRAADDVIVSPTYLPDLVNACLDLLIDGECGVWHLANAGETSWAALAESAAELAGISARTLDSCAFRQLNLPACRPRYSALGSGRGILLPSLDEALRRFVAEWNVPTLTSEQIAA
jgi:dTDP-4-dehydrorhamnose reductase